MLQMTSEGDDPPLTSSNAASSAFRATSSSPVVVRLLGPVEVISADGTSISLTPQAARLLALLAASDAPVDRALIAEHVTRTAAESTAVLTAVSRLRSAVGSLVARTQSGYVLDIAPGESDVGRFRQLLDSASLSHGMDRVVALREALALWRADDPFGVFGGEHWALAQSVELRSLRASATEDLADALLALEDHAGAIAVLRPHTTRNPLDERPVALLMRALAANGKLPDALAEFQRLSRCLVDIGLSPSGDIRRLEHALLRQHDHGEIAVGLNPSAPTGRVAIVFTEVVASAQLWATSARAMSASLKLHDELVETVFATHTGYIFSRRAEGVGAAFADSDEAVKACISLQGALTSTDWPGHSLHVRVGISVGVPEVRDGRYFGDSVNRSSRLAAASNGDQILTCSEVHDDALFEGRDLGEHNLRDVDSRQRIWQVGLVEHPPLRAPSVVPVRLPQSRHRLIGRDDEIESVSAMLSAHRLVTLTGPGGSGKTALATTLGRRSAAVFPGGVYFADLAPIEVGGEVISGFARAIGTSANPSSIDRVIASLPTGDVLFVVDNCEHVLGEVERVVEEIVDRHGQVTVLATSREALRVHGEYVVRLPSLDVSPGGAATELFIERALAARSDATLDDLEAIVSVCERLDGMPLAIEMAAARLRSMSLDELDRRLEDRFRLLSGTHRALGRQQTLETVIAWSYDLLTPAEQQFFRRLAVFSGGFFLESAAVVCDVDEPTAVDLLDALVAKSLVETVEVRGDSRFRLLESLRIFALDRLVELDDAADARRRHANHYASGWDHPQLTVAGHRRHLTDEHNLLAAIDWVRGQTDDPLTLAKLVSLEGPIGALVERRWNEPDTAKLVRQIIAAAQSQPLQDNPRLRVPFVAAAAVGSFASFTNDPALRTAVEDLDRLASETACVMLDDDFRSPNPSCGLLLMHGAHHLLPHRADEARQWVQDFTTNDDYSVRAVARIISELSRAFLDPADPAIDPLRILGDDTPEGPWTNAIAANASYVSVVTGRSEQAAEFLELAGRNTTPGSMSDLNRVVCQVATALSVGHIEDAMTLFLEQIDDIPFGVPGRESTYIALCAWARHLTGDASRAEHLIDHTVKRMPQDYLLTCHIKSIIDGWPLEEFHERSMAWHDNHSTAGNIVDRIDSMPALLAEEVSFWKGRSLSK